MLHPNHRMFWKLALPAIVAWSLCESTELKKSWPRGSIPSIYKLRANELSTSRSLSLLPQQASSKRQRGKPDMLSSSHEALVVTERKYLKTDWCKTQPLRQTVSMDGCLSQTVTNRFCYGQCNSFYIPRHLTSRSRSLSHRGRKEPTRPERDTSFQSCAFCRPHRITTVTVRLHCPGLQPPYRHRKVQRVKQCRCVSVSINDAN